MSNWFSGGKAIDSIAADDRAALYGDGVFETIAIRNGEPRFWTAHGERLQTSCTRLGIDCPGTEELRRELDGAIAGALIDPEFATAKIVVSAGSGPRTYQRLPGTKPVVRVGVFASSPLLARQYQDGVDVRMCATRLAIQPQLAGIKSLNRLEQVLARSEWQNTSPFEGLMLDTDGRLICGTMSNVFIATKSSLATPAITRCGVSGIMRNQVIGWLQAQARKCDVRDIGCDELQAADEIFLTNSQFGVLPVRGCGERRLAIGSLTRLAQQLAAANGVPECGQ